jgi:hypothetical protein
MKLQIKAVLAAVSLSLLVACGPPPPGLGKLGMKGVSGPAGGSGSGKMEKYTIVKVPVAGGKMVGMTYLKPADWTSNDSVGFATARVQYPMGQFTATSPDQNYQLVALTMFMGDGSKGQYQGGMWMDSAKDFMNYVFSKAQGVTSVSYVSADELPVDPPANANKAGTCESKLTTLHVNYTQNGKAMEGIYLVRTDFFTMNTEGLNTVARQFVCSFAGAQAPAGKLQDPLLMRYFNTFRQSITPTDEFVSAANQVGADSFRENMKFAEETHDMWMRTAKERMWSREKQAFDFGEGLNNRREYQGDEGTGNKNLYLDNNMYHYSDGKGTIISVDDPNIDLGPDWKRMEPK